jgi:plastocyanin
MQLRRSTSLALGLVLASVLLAACGDTEPDEASASPGRVSIEEFAFDPDGLTVAAGSSVTWTNLDDVTHSVTQNAGTLDSPDLADGDTYEVTFDEAGTYEYFCKFHPAMQATVTVEG